eukprot:scaffold218_cov169-Ochromonas_danica.AAC.1
MPRSTFNLITSSQRETFGFGISDDNDNGIAQLLCNSVQNRENTPFLLEGLFLGSLVRFNETRLQMKVLKMMKKTLPREEGEGKGHGEEGLKKTVPLPVTSSSMSCWPSVAYPSSQSHVDYHQQCQIDFSSYPQSLSYSALSASQPLPPPPLSSRPLPPVPPPPPPPRPTSRSTSMSFTLLHGCRNLFLTLL